MRSEWSCFVEEREGRVEYERSSMRGFIFYWINFNSLIARSPTKDEEGELISAMR